MKESNGMSNTTELSEAKRALLAKYRSGNLPQSAKAVLATAQPGSAATSVSGERVVMVQGGGSKQPFFFLHGDFKSGAFYCYPMARELGTDQPFYSLEPYYFDGHSVPPGLKTIAAAHIEAMRAIQPQGPYLLCGFCNGGLVAYEMARQLQSTGQRVDLLIVMDPPPFAFLKLMYDLITRASTLMRLSEDKQLYWYLWMRHMHRYLQHLYRYTRFPYYRKLSSTLDSREQSAHAGATSTIMTLKALHERRLAHQAQQLRTDEEIELDDRREGFAVPTISSLFPDAIFPPVEVLRADYGGLFYWSVTAYVPGPYAGKSTFIFFGEDQREQRYRAKWRKLAEAKDKEVEVHVLAGTRDSCKTKDLPHLTACLRACLSKAQAT